MRFYFQRSRLAVLLCLSTACAMDAPDQDPLVLVAARPSTELAYQPFPDFPRLYQALCRAHGVETLPRYDQADMTAADNEALNRHVNILLNHPVVGDGDLYDPLNAAHMRRLYTLWKTLEFFAVHDSGPSTERPRPKPFQTNAYVEQLGNGLFFPPVEGTSANIEIGDKKLHEFESFHGRSQEQISRCEANLALRQGDFDRVQEDQWDESLAERIGITPESLRDVQAMAVSYSRDAQELIREAAKRATAKNLEGAQRNHTLAMDQLKKAKAWLGPARALSFFYNRAQIQKEMGENLLAQGFPDAGLALCDAARWNVDHFSNWEQLVVARLSKNETRVAELLDPAYVHPDGDGDI